MEEKLLPLNFPPGIFANGTLYQAKGRWSAAQLVRFFTKTIRVIDGWQQMTDGNGVNFTTLTPGVARAAIAWRNSDGSILYAFGGTSKLYVIAGLTIYDETPAGFTVGNINATTSTPGTYGNGAYGQGLYGTGQTGVTTGDPDTWTLDIFGTFLVGVSTSDTKLYVWQTATGTPAATPTWGLTTTGTVQTSGSTAGGAVSIVLTSTTMTGTLLQGQQFAISGTTYTATANATAVSNAVTVSILPAVPTTITTGTAVTVASITNQAPLCRAVVVTPEKFLVALGAGDPRTVQWASQATYAVWGPLISNSAGSFPLATRGRIMCGAATNAQTLIWTDEDLWTMTYIGGTLIYGFFQAGNECGIVAPNAKVVIGSTAYWMGRNNFYMYNGYVTPIPCEVADKVFGNIRDIQRAKIWALSMPQYNEVWWFYPSLNGSGGGEIDSYVIYNYRENHWSLGTLARTCGIPTGTIQYPILVDTLSIIWQHEVAGATHSSATPPFLQSGPVEVGAGDIQGYGRSAAGEQLMRIGRVVPDVTPAVGAVRLYVTTQLYPTDPSPITTLIGTMATPTDVRLVARQAQFKFEQVPPDGQQWRIGTMRLGMRPSGKR